MRIVQASGILAILALTAASAFASDGGVVPDPAHGWDELWGHVLAELVVLGGALLLIGAYMLFKYRAGGEHEVGKAPVLSRAQIFGWALIPAFVFLAEDFYLAANGWTLWNIYRTVPKDALEIKVEAQMWSWNFVYGNGANSDVLKVPAGRPVLLRMSSADTIHSFFLPRYRVKEDVMPGRITYLWFYPEKPGKTFVTCAEFCGTQHSQMNTDVETIPSQEFNSWLASSAPKAAPESPGGTQTGVSGNAS